MSSERAGAPTHGALNRENAREVLDEYVAVQRDHGPYTEDAFLDALEACVVPDPRITRIEALAAEAEHNATRWHDPAASTWQD
jgi:hypothetical protein